MSTVAADRLATARSGGVHAPITPWDALVWLSAVAIAVFFALLVGDSTIVGDSYVPRTNDSFYHARRILDAAIGERGFYQFDERLHAPDGAWLSWPWAYDYLMAKAVQLALVIAPGVDPMAPIVYVPVAWILVNAALFMAVVRAIGLSREMQLLAMICFALSPLTQLLHSIGMIDHHYVEHTFVLLAVWLGLRWFANPDATRRAALLGAVLGAAPAFHNGLFILQLLPLAGVFVLWLRGAPPAPRALSGFGVALLAATQLILLPSQPYLRGMFEFGLLSWFHFYVAVCTATVLAFMAWRPYSIANLGLLGGLAAALAAPLAAQVLRGAGFLSGQFSILDQIVEVRSPYRLFTDTFGPTTTASHYSWLLLLAPVLLAIFAFRACTERRPVALYYAIACVFGLALLLDQFRLYYFGMFALLTGGLLLLDELRTRFVWHRGATFAAAFAVVVLAYQPALRERLFLYYAPGGDIEYATAQHIYADLSALCAADPGVVLASADDGNPILFHSDCSVISNNFILRAEDKAHIDEIDRLMRMSPAQIRAARPDIKYVFVRVRDFSLLDNGVARLVADSPIAQQLFIDDLPPAGFTLIKTIRSRMGENGPEGTYARLYKVEPVRDELG